MKRSHPKVNRTRAERNERIANTKPHDAQPKSSRRPKGEHRPREKWTASFAREMNLVSWPAGLYHDHERADTTLRRKTPYRGPQHRGDGHDAERLEKAQAKRERKALKRAGR